ncbi:VCBS repeat-containing protein [Archangium violaceum]|uniref:FG-GAP-like repeat-containing protein n=1 Tax=Archangium violaceum TaxID=83451 RepID=UPI001951016B|nr:FG-GAP-like repeat-containing protein [Archangium violaceum]QRO00671.1 VCBS repeat-containing protein [Archangium violaceum]
MNSQIRSWSRGTARLLLVWLGVTVLACRTSDTPGAPREVRATATEDVITVSWTPPARDGGRRITRYTVTASPGGTAATTEDATSVEVRGARRGVSYTFTVRAANEREEGPESAPSAPVSLAEPVAPDIIALSLAAGSQPGCPQLIYQVRQASARPVDLLVEFDPDGTGHFQRATQAGSAAHEGVTGVPSSSAPEGRRNNFIWDAARDLPGVLAKGVWLRVTASVEGRAGASRTETFTVDNRALGRRRCDPDFVGTRNFYDAPVLGVFEDFDGDGKLDVATVGQYDTVSVWKGLGNGAFQRRTTLDAGPGHSAMATGDFNGDGLVDLATSGLYTSSFPYWYSSPAVNVLLSRADASFHAPLRMPVGDLTATSMVAGDFDKDGRLDLVTTNTLPTGGGEGPVMSLFLGNGDGSFQAPRHIRQGLEASASVRAAYLDEDLNLDLIVRETTGLGVLLGNGDGTFRSLGVAGPATSSFALGDLNADGRVDAVMVNANNALADVLLGRGDGTFQPPVSLELGQRGRTVTIEDLNGDGKPDILLSTLDDTLLVLSGKGDGSFQAARSTPHGWGAFALKVADLDADGVRDLVTLDMGIGYGGSGLSVLRGRGDGTFEVTPRIPSGTRPVALVTTDLNGDGLLDVASANEGGNDVGVLLGNGDGSFRGVASAGVGTKPVALVVADVDVDGRPDLVTANEGSGDVSVLSGNGDGSFRGAASFAVGSGPVALVAVHLDADGKPDLVTLNRATQDVRVLMGNGDGSFGAATAFPVGSEPGALVAGDLDADGKSDLVTANNGSVSVLLGNGDGTFQDARTLALGNSADVLVLGDFDKDGTRDLLVKKSSLLLGLVRGKGDGTFAPPLDIDANTGVILHQLTAADVDGDGILDLVGARGQGIGSGNPREPRPSYFGHNDVAVWRGIGGGLFGPELAYSTGKDPHAVGTGDFDGDGRLDIVAANSASNDVSLLRAR